MATVLAEFDLEAGTLKNCDNGRYVEDKEDPENDTDECLLLSEISRDSGHVSRDNMSDSFCDEIFHELEKTQTFPKFTSWTLEPGIIEHEPTHNSPQQFHLSENTSR